jgi:hypothetical protein
VGGAPGTRCGLGGPSAPALRAALRYSLRAGSAQTRCAQTRAALIRPALRSSAVQQGFRPTRTAYRAPSLTRRTVLSLRVSRGNAAFLRQVRSLDGMHNARFHVGGWFALGRRWESPASTAAKSGSGPHMFEWSVAERVCADPAFREEHREVRRTGGSAAPRQTTRRRPPRARTPHPRPNPQQSPHQPP